ncbi:MAG: ethanolamine ammonia-lyase reactivating factor EutA [Synergistaceae bacterium]|nr:ethanolamine ammonia-lyase reactivating factor EutA [Synergistaceae bacterium]
MRDMNTIAALDIGSNAVRFLICSIEESSDTKKCRKVAFLRVPVRLGEDVFTGGEISARRRMLLCEAMQGFSHLMKTFGVSEYRACATSSMREAKNGDEILDEIMEKSGIQVEVISGLEEAEIIYAAGVSSAGSENWKDSLHVDVGGGSTEVVIYAGGRVAESRSFRLGTVRIMKDAVEEEDKELFKKELKKIGEKYRGLRIIGSGGNINKAQKLLNKRVGEPISAVELRMLYDTLKKMTFEERINNFKLNPYRADVIIPALKIFLLVSKLCCAPTIIVPQVGLVDGIIAMLHAKRSS